MEPKHRHCAFCLKEIIQDQVKTCGKCKRRAYCTEKCQKDDWSPKNAHRVVGGNGQGHKDWCGIEYGEEDMDWEVVPIDGKGLGIKAKRDFQKYERIMVDACQPKKEDDGDYRDCHPGIKDLTPPGATLVEKVEKNVLNEFGGMDIVYYLSLRAARLNHDCDANASHIYDKDKNVLILVAEKEIGAGDEITISYARFNHTNVTGDPERIRNALKDNWNLVCPPICLCRDVKIQGIMKGVRTTDASILTAFVNGQTNLVVGMIRKVLADMVVAKCPVVNRLRSLTTGHDIAKDSKDPRIKKHDMEFIRENIEIGTKIYHPKSKELKFVLAEANKYAPL